MSFIGSTECTRGIVSKLFTGGGDCVNHSSVLPFHGSGPATAPFLTDRTTLMNVSRIPKARMNEPIVETRFHQSQAPMSAYSKMRRGMPDRPSECWIRKVTLKPTRIVQKEALPSGSLSIRPDIFGNQ